MRMFIKKIKFTKRKREKTKLNNSGRCTCASLSEIDRDNSILGSALGYFTCGLMPNIFNEGGTLALSGILTWAKSTANASHHTPKWPMSKTVTSLGRVRTMVLRSYRRRGTILPFSSGMRMPCGDGFGPRPVQNLASVEERKMGT